MLQVDQQQEVLRMLITMRNTILQRMSEREFEGVINVLHMAQEDLERLAEPDPRDEQIKDLKERLNDAQDELTDRDDTLRQLRETLDVMKGYADDIECEAREAQRTIDYTLEE